MAAVAALQEPTARQRTTSFTEGLVNEEELCDKESQRFHRGGKYTTLPIKAKRPERLLPDISLANIGPGADRKSKLATLMSYIRAFSNTIEYELYDPVRWRDVIESRFRAMIDGLKALRHLEDPDFR